MLLELLDGVVCFLAGNAHAGEVARVCRFDDFAYCVAYLLRWYLRRVPPRVQRRPAVTWWPWWWELLLP